MYATGICADNTTDNSPSRDYTHPDDQTALLHVTPVFKPFTLQGYVPPRQKGLGVLKYCSQKTATDLSSHDLKLCLVRNCVSE